MSTKYNSEIDKIDRDELENPVNAIIVCILGLAFSVVVYYHVTGGL